MGELYANVIVDISHERVDRPFQYRVPEALRGKIQVGSPVSVPFGAGNRRRKAYVVELTDRAELDPAKIKAVAAVDENGFTAASQLISLAWWMKERYGSTMNQALKTVLPVKEKIRPVEKKTIRTDLPREELETLRREAERCIKNPNSAQAARLAWYWSHIGSIDLARQLGLITEERRTELYEEMKAMKPDSAACPVIEAEKDAQQ